MISPDQRNDADARITQHLATPGATVDMRRAYGELYPDAVSLVDFAEAWKRLRPRPAADDDFGGDDEEFVDDFEEDFQDEDLDDE